MKLNLFTIASIIAGVTALSSSALAGNGAPSGSHFNLNIIGVSNPRNSSMDCGDGRRIFMPLSGSAKIGLAEGPFAVLDCNGTDGSAKFQLPNPDPDADGITQYSVFARALGRPGGNANMTTCATDPTTGETLCSVNVLSVKRSKGKQTFSNVSSQLLYVDVDIDGDGRIDHIPLFDDRLQDYFWQYDNNGLKLLQLRFYEISTNTN